MSLLQSGWHAVTTHPVVTAILFVMSVAAVAFSAFIGLNVVVTIALLGIVGAGGVVLWWLWTRRRPVEARPVGATAGGMAMVAVVLSGVVTFAVIQLVPYGRSHSNPTVTGEPRWANDRTRELMVNACFACHSNEVEYPPYASVAPISWMVQHHVDEGRGKVNYSEFATDQGDADESVKTIEEGEMPPSYFTRFGLHPNANLTASEIAELIDGLKNTPGLSGG